LTKAPAPQNVNVVNTPDVNVVNLPLDADGAVRVTSACPTAPPLQARYVNLLPNGPLSMGPREVVFTETVDAHGFSRVGVIASGTATAVRVEWTWANLDPLFGGVTDSRNGGLQAACSDFTLSFGQLFEVKEVCVVSGEQVRLRLECWDTTCPVAVAGVYLIP
jgi:hypothetical protein